MPICNDLRTLFPKYILMHYDRDTVEIHEREANAKVRKVTWTNSCFQHIDPAIAKDCTSFFQIAASPDIFLYDCDGITLFEENGRKYMFLSELKSTFDSGDIYHAKNQIISSFMKINMLMHLVRGYKLEDHTVKGFIFSRPFNKSYLWDLYHAQYTNPKKRYSTEAEFILDLCYHKKTTVITPRDTYELKDLPLGERGIFSNIEIHYVPVADGQDSITLDIHQYI